MTQKGDARSGDVVYQLCQQRPLRRGTRVLVELADRLKVSPQRLAAKLDQWFRQAHDPYAEEHLDPLRGRVAPSRGVEPHLSEESVVRSCAAVAVALEANRRQDIAMKAVHGTWDAPATGHPRNVRPQPTSSHGCHPSPGTDLSRRPETRQRRQSAVGLRLTRKSSIPDDGRHDQLASTPTGPQCLGRTTRHVSTLRGRASATRTSDDGWPCTVFAPTSVPPVLRQAASRTPPGGHDRLAEGGTDVLRPICDRGPEIRHRRQLGRPDVRLHDLRHTVVSLLMELGVPPTSPRPSPGTPT